MMPWQNLNKLFVENDVNSWLCREGDFYGVVMIALENTLVMSSVNIISSI